MNATGAPMSWDLEAGDLIRRTDFHARFRGSGQGGIAPLASSPNVLVFSDPASGARYGYHDRWEDGVFHYTGEVKWATRG